MFTKAFKPAGIAYRLESSGQTTKLAGTYKLPVQVMSTLQL